MDFENGAWLERHGFTDPFVWEVDDAQARRGPLKVRPTHVRAMGVSGVMVMDRAEWLGIPYVEAILSVLPAVDELVVGVGQHNDPSVDTVKLLAENHPEVRMVRQAWPEKGIGGEVVGRLQSRLLLRAEQEWVLVTQADEVWHESSARVFQERLAREGTAGKELARVDLSHNMQMTRSRLWMRRVARKDSGVFSRTDGLHLQFNGLDEWNWERLEMPAPVYNCTYNFPINALRKTVYYSNFYQEELQQPEKRLKFEDAEEKLKRVDAGDLRWLPEHFRLGTSDQEMPAILRGLVGMLEYKVRPELKARLASPSPR